MIKNVYNNFAHYIIEKNWEGGIIIMMKVHITKTEAKKLGIG
jgi:hypothetical protein